LFQDFAFINIKTNFSFSILEPLILGALAQVRHS